MPEDYDRIDDRTEDEDDSVGAGSGTSATFSSGNQNSGPRAKVGDDGDGNVDEQDYDDNDSNESTTTSTTSTTSTNETRKIITAPFVAKISEINSKTINLLRIYLFHLKMEMYEISICFYILVMIILN